MTRSDLESIAKGVWWLVLIRGVLAILFGVFALFWPGVALLTLVYVFGAYAILDGIAAIVAGIRHRKEEGHWVWQIIQGVISIAAGVIAFVWPGVTLLAILFLIAFWAIVAGIAEIVQSVNMRRTGTGSWGWMLAAGILGVVFGILLLVWPGTGIVTLLWLAGIYAIIFGVIIVVLAFKVRGAVKATGDATAAPPSA